jgi:hypothetical protein
MEDVLSLYQQDYDANNPLICFDERPCHLIDNVYQPLPMKPSQPKREDYHYQRNGMCNLFIAFQPHTGERIVAVYERKTHKEYADFFNQISQHYPNAESITVVQDNLSTHSPASFYKVFKAEEAFALAQKYKMHYTPTNASWLNMAEIELSALSKQCLSRRIPDMETLEREALAWAFERNQKGITVKWQFTNDKAREKFNRFYPIK